MRRSLSAMVFAALAPLVAPAWAGTPAPGFTDTLYVGSLDQPTAIAFLPDGRLLITEKGGNLVLFDGSTTTTLVTIPVCSDSEMGLLGVAVDPSFSTNGFIYLYRTNAADCSTSTGRFNGVVRVTMSGASVSLGSLTVLLSGIVTDNGNHDGGVLRIGPVDQKLYVGAGDSGNGDNQGGPGSSTNPYAQDLTSLNGKILRLNLDGTAPVDNPFVGMGIDRPEIWAYGFRNPFRMSFDGGTGKLWIGDVGDLTVEEVDIGVAGGNYSWPLCEGNLQGPPNMPQPCARSGDIAPVFTYPHGGATSLGTCLIGGAFAGSAFGSMTGDYVFGDCTASEIYYLALNVTRDGFVGSAAPVSTAAGTPSDFVQGPDGAVYYVAFSDAEVRRLAPVVSATDTLLAGSFLGLRDNAVHPGRKGATAVSKDTAAIDLGGGPGSGDDPTLQGGSLRVVSTTGGFDNTYPMPASAWHYIGEPAKGKGYWYRDRKLVNGPVRMATLKGGKLLRVSGRGSGLGHTLASNPDPVSVVLQTGGKHYCLTFGTSTSATMKFTSGTRFTARHASAPAACPP
jgi:glucose/arabinose dehydrogenase